MTNWLKSPRTIRTVPEVVAADMSDACDRRTQEGSRRPGVLKSVQKYEPCEPVYIWRIVLNVALFATQVAESS